VKRIKERPAKKFFIGLIIIITTLGAAHLMLQYLNLNYFNQESGVFFELTNRFDFDDEASVPTWISQLLFLLISASAGLLVVLEKIKPRKILWGIVSIVALIGSLDEVATLHENVLQSLHLLSFDESSPTILANAWLFIVPFLLIATVVFVAKATTLLPKRTIRLIVIAATVYLIGAVVTDIVTSSAIADSNSSTFMTEGVLVAIEELLELIGLSIMLYATVDYTERKFSGKLKRAKKELVK